MVLYDFYHVTQAKYVIKHNPGALSHIMKLTMFKSFCQTPYSISVLSGSAFSYGDIFKIRVHISRPSLTRRRCRFWWPGYNSFSGSSSDSRCTCRSSSVPGGSSGASFPAPPPLRYRPYRPCETTGLSPYPRLSGGTGDGRR